MRESADGRFSWILDDLERVERERDEALGFLKRASTGPKEIVSTGRLTELEIANYRAARLLYVEPGGGLGWVCRESRVLEMVDKDLDSARARLAALIEAASAVVEAGLEFADPRVSYECWQIDSGAMDKLRKAIIAAKVER